MRRQVLLLLFSLFAIVGFAQQRTVTGTVVSAEDGLPVIGASVHVKGTSQGATTDLDGKYSIKVNENASLTFSYVGMQPKTVQVGNQSVINVTLTSSSTQLDEVVVTAMGIREEKKKLNFAVQSLNADEVTAGQSANFVILYKGKLPVCKYQGVEVHPIPVPKSSFVRFRPSTQDKITSPCLLSMECLCVEAVRRPVTSTRMTSKT